MGKFTQRSLVTLAGQIGVLVLGTATSMLLARALGPDGKGVYTICALLPFLAATLCELGVVPANAYFLARRRHPPAEVLGNSLLLAAGLGGAGMLLAAGAAQLWGGTFFVSIPRACLFASLILIPGQLFFLFIQSVSLGLQQFQAYNRAAVLRSAIFLAAAAVAVGPLKGGVGGAIASAALSFLAAGAFLLRRTALLTGRPVFRPDRAYLRDWSRFGLQSHIGNLLVFLNSRADMFLVHGFLGPAALGFYSVGVLLAEQIWLLSNASQLVVFLHVAAEDDPSARAALTPQAARVTLLATIPAAVLLWLVAGPVVQLLFSRSFLPAARPLRALLPGAAALGISRILGNDIAGRGKPLINAYVNAGALVLNLGLNLLWIPRLGITGAALASSVSYAATLLARLVIYGRLSGNSWTRVLIPRPGDLSLLLRMLRPAGVRAALFGNESPAEPAAARSGDGITRVALITRCFYPDVEVAAKRAVNLYRHLNEREDLEVDVLTNSLNRDGQARNDFPLDLSRVRYLDPYRNRLEKAFFMERTPVHKILARTLLFRRIEDGFPRAVEERGNLDVYDVIYLTLPPFAPFLRLALRLKRRHPGTRLILEYRDEWIGGLVAYAEQNRLIHPYRRAKGLYRKIRHDLGARRAARLEAQALGVADRVVVVSREMRDNLLRRIDGLDGGRIVWIPNGIGQDEIAELSRLARENLAPPAEILSLVYAGTLFGPQDIRPLLRAAGRLIETGRIRPGDLGIDLYGRHEQHAADWPANMKRLVKFRGPAPRREIFRQYFLHDVIVFLIGDWPGASTIVTGKIHELVESGRPILALLPPGLRGDARSLLERTDAAVIIDIRDEAAIGEALLDLLGRKRLGRPLAPPRRDLDWFHGLYHYRSICQTLYETCLRPPGFGDSPASIPQAAWMSRPPL